MAYPQLQIIAVGRRPHFYLYDLAGSKVERLSGPPEVKLKSLETFVATQGALGSIHTSVSKV